MRALPRLLSKAISSLSTLGKQQHFVSLLTPCILARGPWPRLFKAEISGEEQQVPSFPLVHQTSNPDVATPLQWDCEEV